MDPVAPAASRGTLSLSSVGSGFQFSERPARCTGPLESLGWAGGATCCHATRWDGVPASPGLSVLCRCTVG